jgi:hypothetical protein
MPKTFCDDTYIQSHIKWIHELIQKRYPHAKTAFWAGSTSCNPEMPGSDFDIVIVFEKLPNAHREAFIHEGKLIDAFIHDIETMNYFFDEVDSPSHAPALPHMIYSGIEIPKESSFGEALKKKARLLLEKGPSISDSSLQYRRFLITDLLDDLKNTSDSHEFLTTCSCLHQALCEFYLLAHQQWIGKGKMLIKLLRDFNPHFEKEIQSDYYCAIKNFQSEPMEKFTQKLLDSYGGMLWDGFLLKAPSEWRKPE